MEGRSKAEVDRRIAEVEEPEVSVVVDEPHQAREEQQVSGPRRDARDQSEPHEEPVVGERS